MSIAFGIDIYPRVPRYLVYVHIYISITPVTILDYIHMYLGIYVDIQYMDFRADMDLYVLCTVQACLAPCVRCCPSFDAPLAEVYTPVLYRHITVY